RPNGGITSCPMRRNMRYCRKTTWSGFCRTECGAGGSCGSVSADGVFDWTEACMMQTRTRTGIRHLLGAVVLGAGACLLAGGALAATPPDTLVIGKPADPQTLDPAVTIDNNDWTVTYPAYQRLMRYKQVDGQGSTEVEGDLAASWSASPDSLVWTFKLHDGQRFADGSPVDAGAVKQSFERLLAKKQGPSEA